MEEDLKAFKNHKTSLNIYLLPHSALSWILNLAENPAILWLQDGATEWHYYQEDFFVLLHPIPSESQLDWDIHTMKVHHT